MSDLLKSPRLNYHCLSRMRLLIVLLSIFARAAVLFAQTPYLSLKSVPSELEGDKLGESLGSFVSRHPKTHCVVNSTSKITSCSQWENVSILGMTVHADPACSPETQSSTICADGLNALFKDDRLSQISYEVGGTDKSAVVAYFTKNYGKPSVDTPTNTAWISKERTFSVYVARATREAEGPFLIHLTLLSVSAGGVGVLGGRPVKPGPRQ